MHEATVFDAVPGPGAAGSHVPHRVAPVRACRACKSFGSSRVVEHPSGPVLVCMACGVAQREVDGGWSVRAFAVPRPR